MQHSFDTEIAEEYGLTDAIMFNHIGYWVLNNKANERNFHDGYYWTFNSVKALKELFPYLSEKKIRGALDRLETNGLILSGSYNEIGYDRTKWYTLSPKGQMHFTKRANGIIQKGEPIPYINTYIKPVNNIYIEPVSNIISYLNNKLDSNYKSNGKNTISHITARLKEGYTEEDFYRVIDFKVKQWGSDEKMKEYLRPSTLFGTKFESYLQNAPEVKKEPVKEEPEEEILDLWGDD